MADTGEDAIGGDWSKAMSGIPDQEGAAPVVTAPVAAAQTQQTVDEWTNDGVVDDDDAVEQAAEEIAGGEGADRAAATTQQTAAVPNDARMAAMEGQLQAVLALNKQLVDAVLAQQNKPVPEAPVVPVDPYAHLDKNDPDFMVHKLNVDFELLRAENTKLRGELTGFKDSTVQERQDAAKASYNQQMTQWVQENNVGAIKHAFGDLVATMPENVKQTAYAIMDSTWAQKGYAEKEWAGALNAVKQYAETMKPALLAKARLAASQPRTTAQPVPLPRGGGVSPVHQQAAPAKEPSFWDTDAQVSDIKRSIRSAGGLKIS